MSNIEIQALGMVAVAGVTAILGAAAMCWLRERCLVAAQIPASSLPASGNTIRYYHDADGHIGGAWKLMDPHNPTRRIGTLDANLNIIGD